jgi:raffinose/stachyose/melibiose transport system permease protein
MQRKTLTFDNRRRILGYFFLLPFLAMLTIFMFYPIVESIVKSFTNWSGMTDAYEFIGWRNYVRIFTEMPEYWRAMLVNVKYAVIATTVQTALGFFLAVMVINLTRRWQAFYKVALYLPVILPAAAIAVMWRYIYTPEYGLLNQLLRLVGLSSLTHTWTGEQATALGSVIVTNTWRYAGFTMVLYYVSMLDISKEILESAKVDGAGRWAQIRYFYFPLTRGATEINFVLSITGCLRVFDIFYLLTGGGPGTHTKVVSMWIMETAFQSFKFGRALAMSIVLFLIVVVTMVVFRTVLAAKEDNN